MRFRFYVKIVTLWPYLMFLAILCKQIVNDGKQRFKRKFGESFRSVIGKMLFNWRGIIVCQHTVIITAEKIDNA